jgi:DNA-binding NtrC family response regulator
VGDLSLEAQAKLLRFLEDGEYYGVGGTKKLQIRTRVVSATNKNLESLIEKDLFRRDLYFRLGVVKVQIPSLNERREDIIPLAKHFLYEFGKKFGKKFTRISARAERVLIEYQWMGNVRELKNLIERGTLIGRGPELTIHDLGIAMVHKDEVPEHVKSEIGYSPIPPTGITLYSVQESLEKYYIEEALKMAEGNESEAARLLNMNHHTFRYRRKKLHIE